MPTKEVNKPSLIVGVGASAGGLDSFKALFSQMPKDTDMAFVLLPHLDPNYQSMMVTLLGHEVKTKVLEAQENMLVEANHIYILPPGKQIAIDDGRLHLSQVTEPRKEWTAIEHFLRSLAKDQQERSVAIILSGTGCHGTLAFRDIKLAGGMIIAQDPSTTNYNQMPTNAIDTGLVDLVVAPEDMPAALMEYAAHPYVKEPNAQHIDETVLSSIAKILAFVRTHAKYDFSGYRSNMVLRRIQRRMCVCHSSTLDEYYQFLQDNHEEAQALKKDLLIGVTAFFRDEQAFITLEKTVIPELVERSNADNPVRIWVPACASGEEVYSIAILLFEAFTHANKPVNAQIFASDIDEESLKVARKGEYPLSIATDVSADRLHRFFDFIDDKNYQIKKVIREMVVFAVQNLISDTPFSRLDLISCRNLFIYLQPQLQSTVLTLFHFALKNNGFLMLGPSESLGIKKTQFEVISKKWRIFKAMSSINKPLTRLPVDSSRSTSYVPVTKDTPINYKSPSRFADLVNRDLMEAYAPAAVLINRAFEILHFHGPTVNYLEFPKGTPSHDLTVLLRDGLRARVRTAVHYVLKENQAIVDNDARVKRHGHYEPCVITVRPVFDPLSHNELLLITFEEKAVDINQTKPLTAQVEILAKDSTVIEQLEYELTATREDLQSTVEELESSNEELKASNEEIMSMNEELQSANEELETSKEELQSMNEELNTVNTELQYKVEELEKSYDDTSNLLSSTDIATVFLNREMQVMLFNPPVEKLLNLRETDIGRSISDFSAQIANHNLLTDARLVLEKLAPVEKDVWTKGESQDKQCYLRRIVPYRTADDRINGVVITFVDITERYRQKQYLEECVQARTKSLNDREARLSAIMKYASEAIVVMDLNGKITDFNQSAERVFGYESAEVLGKNIEKLLPSIQLETLIPEEDSIVPLEVPLLINKVTEIFGKHKSGIEIPVGVALTLVGNKQLYVCIINDLRSQKVLEKAIVDISCQEQEKIGRDIHDSLGQKLTGINLLVSDLRRGILAGEVKDDKQINEIIDQLSLAIGETRSLSHGLSPIAFAPQGLHEALKSLVEMTSKSNIDCQVEFGSMEKISDQSVAIQIYRIAQEALNNIIKHAKASKITLKLYREADKWHLLIQDNGQGFNPQKLDFDQGIGLRIMQYRASSINAKLTITSTPSNGTCVSCVF
ncbi:CheR family methyltransferase [Colwelliaceae bacterium 6471]